MKVSLKWCNQCKTNKSVNEFYRDKNSKDGLCNRCKDCKRRHQRAYSKTHKEKIRAYDREWRRNNPNHTVNHNLKRNYGITLDQYDQILESQGGVCAICKGTSTDGKRLHVDHCHADGKIRGLLCNSCNAGIGRFKDSVEKLLSAAIYLEKSNGIHS